MLIDYHLHTRFSDGIGEPKDYAKRAEKLGLDEIGITDHCPMPQPIDDWHMTMENLETYVQLIEEAQRQFPAVNIRLGLEMDYLPGMEDFTRDLAAMYPWDYFLGSVHYIGEWNLDSHAEDWRGRDVDAVWRDYFDLWTKAAQSGLYDSLAHPDLPKKFGFIPQTDLRPSFEKALMEVKKAGVAIELSTAGLRKPCKEFYPSRAFLKIARRLDVPLSLGSDAHVPQDLGAGFGEAVAFARSVGYQKICRFNQRKRDLVPLGE